MAGTTLADQTMQMNLKEFIVSGRALPTEQNPEPTVYRMSIFARDTVVAKSRFWYFMKRLQRVKRSNGEVLECREEPEKDTDSVKNYGIWLRYDSRTQTINMYKEFRDISKVGAVSQLYTELASRHRAASCSVQILKVKELAAEEIRRPHILQLLPEDLKFPQLTVLPMCPKSRKSTFCHKSIGTFRG